jgi:hypothetical protein
LAETKDAINKRLRREIASLKATHAPVIYFDAIGTGGAYSGIANVTLECGLHLLVDGEIVNGRQAVAQLRFPVAALGSLKAVIAHIEKSLQPRQEMPQPKEAKS